MKEFWKWVTEAFQPHIYDEIENYLSEATDLQDLERRMRILRNRGMPV